MDGEQQINAVVRGIQALLSNSPCTELKFQLALRPEAVSIYPLKTNFKTMCNVNRVKQFIHVLETHSHNIKPSDLSAFTELRLDATVTESKTTIAVTYKD